MACLAHYLLCHFFLSLSLSLSLPLEMFLAGCCGTSESEWRIIDHLHNALLEPINSAFQMVTAFIIKGIYLCIIMASFSTLWNGIYALKAE